MTNIEYLQDFIGTTITHLEHIRANGVKKELSFTISCKDLDGLNHSNFRQSEKFKPIFDQLKDAKGPTLYWFEIISDTNTEEVIKALTKYKKSENSKATPALKTTINYHSKTLYVGKVKEAFEKRLIQHLGFFNVNATQGLQLFHWTKDLSLDLKINILVFHNNMADMMPVIEYAFAQRLQPLAGKHK